ncbi:MAG: hypothetical protein WA208_01900 [Thermoanaerobaculia bacterium]
MKKLSWLAVALLCLAPCGNVSAQTCPPSVELMAPAAGATLPSPFVTLSWNPVPSATRYDIFLGPVGSGCAGHPVGSSETNMFIPPPLLPNTTYDWRVVAMGACPTVSSVCQTFTTPSATANCPSSKPVLREPAPNATIPPGQVILSWDPVANAIDYEVFAAIAGGPFTPLGRTSMTQFSAQFPADTVVDWYVRAMGDPHFCPTPVESNKQRFTTQKDCPKGPVSLLTPRNGDKVHSDVVFSWEPVPNATAYVLVVAIGDGGFENYGSTTEITLRRAVPAGSSVRWGILAMAKDCGEVHSAIWSFETIARQCTDATITLRSPMNSATLPSPVRFEWSAVDNATTYRVWVSSGDGAPEIAARTTATEATITLGSGTIRWSVEALRQGCPPIISPAGQFTVTPASTCGSNTAPTLVSPIGSEQSPVAVTKEVTVKWNAVPNAIGYRVWVARSGQPYSDIAVTKETQLTREVEESGRFSWYVQALFEGCPATKSEKGWFEVPPAPCAPTTPTVLSPATGSHVQSPVTFAWTAVDGAAEYRILLARDGGQPFVLATTTETTETIVLLPGSARFSIEAVFDECPSTFSQSTPFVVSEAQNCPTTQPVLLAPVNGASSVSLPLDLSWSAVPNAIRYVVMLRYNGGEATPAGDTTATQVTLRNLPAGRFEWWVLAFLSGCKPVQSDHSIFSTPAPENCTNGAALLFEPRNGVVLHAAQVDFDWSAVKGAKSYKVWVTRGDDDPTSLATTTDSKATFDVPAGKIRWHVEALFDGCPSTYSARAAFVATGAAPPCRTPPSPRTNVVGQAASGSEYSVRWTPMSNVDRYDVQESTTSDFANATTQTIDGISAAFTHTVESATKYFYRVRAISSCSDDRSEYSEVVGVLVVPPRATGSQRNASAEVGVQSNIVQTVFVPGAGAGATFTATVDKKWLTVQPASGSLPEAGLTLNVLSDASVLPLGTNTGTVSVVVTTPSNAGVSVDGTTVATLPISISLITPVTPAGKSSPPPESLIIPAVAHAEGQNDSLFESDIRLTNLSAETAKYQINFTPSGVDGTKSGTTSTVEVAPNQTVALDDILATMFGTGSTSVLGMLEIRPLTSTSSSSSYVTTSTGIQPLPTAASSRTYNLTPTGTFGQYIPALPFSQFVGKGTKLSIQQIAQSTAFRTNFGFAEASGQAADLLMKVYDTKNNLLKEIPLSLLASEHKQINSLLANYGISNLQDGRVEVEVLSSTGKVTAYASTVDNATNDPLLVWPSVLSAISETRYVIPGVAFANTGAADWRTDVRVFNGGAAEADATFTFYPQFDPGSPVSKSEKVGSGEVLVLDNILSSFFAQASPSPGGSVVVTTAAKSSIVATARTYNQTTNGTYGQFIPAVTPSQAAGRGERSLQLLQIEQSSRIRTNIGLAETSGSSAKVEVSLVLPDSKATPYLEVELAANEFRQIPVSAFGITDALYNVRAAVRVVDGNGRVTAYASAIDMVTQDPTYVPAQ